MQIMGLITALPGAAAQGLIWGIMAIGVYLTFRILDVADLTVDGSFGTGGAVCVMCLLSGMNVWAALLVAVLAGLLTGCYNEEDSREHVLKVYNWADYIGEGVLEDFKQYYKEQTGE